MGLGVGIMKNENGYLKFKTLVCAAIFCSLVICTTVAGWHIETVDSNSNTAGTYQGGISIAIDSLGAPKVVFCPYLWPSSIYYSSKESGTWQSAVVITQVYPMSQPSLKFGSDGIPRIVYFDPSNEAIFITKKENGNWISEKIDKSYYDGYMLSPHDFALDTHNQAHIVYAGYKDYRLKHAWFDSETNTWKNETIDTDVGISISVAIDSLNHLHVAYIDKGQTSLKYAYNNGNQWTIQTLYNGGNQYSVNRDCSIDVDGENKPHIVFSKSTPGELNYAYLDGNEWTITSIPNQYGEDLSLDVDEDGIPHIACTDHGNGTNAELKYIWYDRNTWKVHIVDTEGDTGHACELKLNSTGTAFIIYYDDTPLPVHRLLLAINNPPVLTTIGNKVINEGEPFSFTVSATDGDVEDTLTLSASGVPVGATFTDGTFTWSNPVKGLYEVTFTVSDGTFSDSETVTIKVVDPYQWNAIGPDGKNVRSLALSPGYVTDGTIGGGTLEGNSAPGAFIKGSSDGGSWTIIPVGTLPNVAYEGIAFSPDYASDHTIYLAGQNSGGLFVSNDGGATWVQKVSSMPFWDVAVTSDGTVYAAADNGIYTSTNGGTSFTRLTGDNAPTGQCLAVAVSGDGTVYAGTTNNGVYKSEDKGQTWIQVNTGLPISDSNNDIYDVAVAPDGTAFCMVYTHGIYRSKNGGTSWDLVNSDAYNSMMQCMAVSPNYLADHTIFAGYATHYGTWQGVAMSQDGGDNWVRIDNTGLPGSQTPVVAVSPNFANDRTIFAGTGNGVWRIKLSIDTAAPEFGSGVPAEGSTVMAVPEGGFVVSASDNSGTVTVSYEVSGAGTASGSGMNTVTIPAETFTADGTYTVTVTATDAAGNESILTFTVKVDNTGPEITEPAGAPDSGGNLVVTVGDAVSATYSINGGEAVTVTPENGEITIPGFTADGTYTVTVTATDGSGNESILTFTVVVDNSQDDVIAPLISDLLATPNPVPINTPITVTSTIDDSLTGESTITCVEYSTDGNTWFPMSAADGAFDEPTEIATITLPGKTSAEVLSLSIRAADAAGNTAISEPILVAIYDPNGAFVTAGGWILSPAGAYKADPGMTGKANLGLNCKYKKGTTIPTGETEFHLKDADLKFKSTSYDWLVISGGKAIFKGTGTINGAGQYGFIVSVIAGEISGGEDKFRIKIWEKTTNTILYDNGVGSETADPLTPLNGGNVKIHK